MKRYLVALDQGTTSSRTLFFNKTGAQEAMKSFEFPQQYPKLGWVEQNPQDIVDSQLRSLKEAMEIGDISANEIFAIGITNQRETTIVWERETGKPVCPAIVWQCRRTAPLVEQLKKDGVDKMIREKTGLIPDAYFSATKLRWILDEYQLQARAENGELCFGTVDSYLAFQLLEGNPHVTDATNASRTMLFNIYTQQWDEDLLKLLNIPLAMMPEVIDSASQVGVLKKNLIGAAVPVCALAGDQHAALFGQGCLEPGMVKNTYGTGCFMLMNTGDKPVTNDVGLLTTMAWRIKGKVSYALEGSVFVAGAAMQWLRDKLGLISTAQDSGTLASLVQDNGGVFLVPAFTGLGAPYWNMYARGGMFGLTRGSTKAHVVRATLESIGFQSNDLLHVMEKAAGFAPKSLRVDGGASTNDLLMQFQADISDLPIIRPVVQETTALGAALLAGIGSGLFENEQEAVASWQEGLCYEPKMDAVMRKDLLRGWRRAIDTSLFYANWSEEG